jgi:hypothetical protein
MRNCLETPMFRRPIEDGRRPQVPFHNRRVRNMSEYEVTFTNGETVEIEAWTAEAAEVIAIEDAEIEGRIGLSVVSVTLLTAREIEF